MNEIDMQRLERLERRRDELWAWRHALEVPIVNWTFTPPQGQPVPMCLGDMWPSIDADVREGPVRFEAEFDIPQTFAGRPVEFEADVGGEAFVRLSTGASGGLNPYHRTFPIAQRARGGEHIQVVVEAVPKGLFGAPSADPRLRRAHVVAVEPGVHALVRDLEVVLEAARVLDGHEVVPRFLAVTEMTLDGLPWPSAGDAYLARLRNGSGGRSFVERTWSLPPSLPAAKPLDSETLEHVERARAVLATGLRQIRESYPPVGRLALSGHAHLDLAWLWPMHETQRKARRTFYTVLDLMDRHDDFVFNQSSAQVYTWIERDDPALFERLHARVAEGRFEPVGGMWAEPDCQMTGGESLVRQLLYGQHYFERRFGRRSTVAWLPDTFGFTPALPQLLVQSGITGFFTTKLNWNETTRFPYDLFWWEGLDGSRVLAHTFHNPGGTVPGLGGYNGDIQPLDLLGTWRNFKGKDVRGWGIRPAESLLAFGYGDGGGGPSEEMLEAYARLCDFPALPRLRMTRVDDFFNQLPHEDLPVWVGELYLELHRGTLTSQARIKHLNRQAEHRLLEAEAFASLALMHGHAYPATALEAAWQSVLLNQFHDILPGSSIREVYADAVPQLERAIATAGATRDAALTALAREVKDSSEQWWVVANPAIHDRPLQVVLPGTTGAAVDADGRVLSTQVVEGGLLVHAADVRVSSLGLMSIRVAPGPLPPIAARVWVRQHGNNIVLENKEIMAHIGSDGTVQRIFDQVAKREILAGRGNQLVAYADLPRAWEAWDVAGGVEMPGEEVGGVEAIEIVASGPLQAAVRVRRRWRSSRITQTYCLMADGRRLEIHTQLDWHERRILLRAVFPLAVRAHEAWFETAFGAQARPTHRNMPADAAKFEVSGHRWVDVSEPGYGVSLLNNGKYGHSVLGSTLALSLVRGPMWPDPTADAGTHEFAYALYPHAGDWREAGTVREAFEFNSPLVACASAGPTSTDLGIEVTGLPLALGSLKKAEDGDALILRMYEPHGARGHAKLAIRDLRHVERVNLMEETMGTLETEGGYVTIMVHPFELVTLRLVIGAA